MFTLFYKKVREIGTYMCLFPYFYKKKVKKDKLKIMNTAAYREQVGRVQGIGMQAGLL